MEADRSECVLGADALECLSGDECWATLPEAVWEPKLPWLFEEPLGN